MGWLDDAECADIPKGKFFVSTGELYSDRVLEACAMCPVWEPCLMEALSDRDTVNHGYRAGTTPRTRQRMIRDAAFLRGFIAHRRERRQANA